MSKDGTAVNLPESSYGEVSVSLINSVQSEESFERTLIKTPLHYEECNSSSFSHVSAID